jgi:YHS domain-containing protein
LARDVVCNMKVDERTAKWRSEYEAKTYFFCSPVCKQEFEKNPLRFVKPA